MNTGFKSSDFCIAFEMLKAAGHPSNGGKKHKYAWNTTNPLFKAYKRSNIVSFFNTLIIEHILKRAALRGPKSGATLANPQKLLDMCVNGFKDNQQTKYEYVTKQSHKQVIQNLIAKKIKFYIGGFSGVRDGLVESMDNRLIILITDRTYFSGEKQYNLQMDLKISKVTTYGDIKIILPKYHKFLEKEEYQQTNSAGVSIPSDFYTYLYMRSSIDPMAQHQANHMESLLSKKTDSFLYWQGK